MKQLYFGDCLDVLKELYEKHPDGFIDLIYIDPPFNSKRNYNILFEDLDMTDTKAQKQAFADTWSNVSYIDTLNEIYDLNKNLYNFLKTLDSIGISKSAVAYLTTMAIRIFYIRKVLKDTGSFYLHCDPNMSHYLKLVCDLIFGKENFKNELVWCYSERGISKRYYNKKHDIILFYVKNDNKYIFNYNEVMGDYSLITIKKFKYIDENGRRFRIRGRNIPEAGIHRRKTDIPISEENEYTYRQYLDDSKGTLPKDWFLMQFINQASKERLGYPTQKPEALLERIVRASSNEGDLVADFFCGCGTTIAVANRLNRNWLGVDISHLAIRLVLKRLTDPYEEEMKKKIRSEIEIHGFPKDIASAKELAQKDKKGRFEFQEWVVEVLLNGIHNPKKVADGGWDGYITFPKSEKEKGIILIEVKSGGVTVKNIREFINVIQTENADLGIFVCFTEEVTKPMLQAAKNAGKYKGYQFDHIQIMTIEDILDGREIKMPGGVNQSTFKNSTKRTDPEIENHKLFD